MDLEEFDMRWRFQAINIAANELIEYDGKIVLVKVIERAKRIYERGYRLDIHKWKSPIIKDKPTNEKKPSKQEKYCPKCNEIVPVSWTEHKYSNNGSKCGHKWEG